ncbi:MAG: adenylate/guanylate cyclase domain-containing protein [Abitibacteriaceae bacterium]|nr:adenylate/guanylate cyclase domain-containing protein [Abditibacteriaceae bacterium]
MKTPKNPDSDGQMPALQSPVSDHHANGAADEAATDLARVGTDATLTSEAKPARSSDGVPDFPDLPDLADLDKGSRFSLPVINWAASRAELTAVILSFVVFLLLVPQVLHFSHRYDTNRIVWNALPLWNTLERWEYSLYDERFAARGQVFPKSRDKIAIIAVDQNSLGVIGKWPWPRSLHAQIVRKLQQAGAKVIALDFDFSDKQNGANAALSKSDKDLVNALGEAKNVILPSFIEQNQAGHQNDADVVTDRFTSPYDELDEKTADPSVAYVAPDSADGNVRRTTFRAIRNDATIGAFAALAAASLQEMLEGKGGSCVEDKACQRYKQALATATWPTLDGTSPPVPVIRSSFGKEDKIETMLINFWGPPSVPGRRSTFDIYSFADVLNGNSGEYSQAKLKEKFAGRIVFVGPTALILKDLFPMPQFESSTFGVETQMPGVEIHATATAMLLDGTYIHTVSTATTLWTLLGLTLIASLWVAVLRGWISTLARKAQTFWTKKDWPGSVHSIVWFGLYLCLGALPVMLFWQGAKWLFAHNNLWVITAYPMVGACLSSGTVLLILFGAESAERRKALVQFSRFVSPDVLDEILAHPEEDYPRPRRVHGTVLFTDLEGFTTYSENHEPEQVIECLNAYMDRMVPIVMSYGGTMDKFIGDAIMAYFGAPIPRYDHAAQALLCAIALQEECARFREETGIQFFMRIGIHTGDVIVGSMGGGEYLNYTVIGDTVNLASRLEGKNKEFGSWIMCSAATYEAAPHVVCVESASAQVKGKVNTVEVYIVRGLADAEPIDTRWGKQLTAEQKREQLMEAHRKRLAEAEAALEEAKQLPAPLLALPEGIAASDGQSNGELTGSASPAATEAPADPVGVD